MYSAPIPDASVSRPSLDLALELVAGQLDEAFVGSGKALAGAYDLVEKLIAKLAGAGDALDRTAARRAVANMQQMGARIATLPAAIDARGQALAVVAAVNGEIGGHVFAFDRTLEFLRVCAFNIKIAAAGEGGFSEFGDVMISRLDVSGVAIRAIRRDMQQLLSVIPAVAATDRTLARQHGALAADAPQELARNAVGLEGYLEAAAERSGTIASIAGAIRTRLAEALGAMQIGDITRQRLEHVVDGLRLLFADEAPDGPDRSQLTPSRRHVLAMLHAQVSQTRADFLEECARLAQSQQLIGPELSRLLGIGKEEDAAGGSAHFLLELERKVEAVSALTGELRDVDRRSHALAGETVELVTRLGERLAIIHRVTAEVDNMAWNAEIRCDHMGESGRALAPIASEIRKLVGRLKAISSEVQRAVERLNAAASTIAGEASCDPDNSQTLEHSLATIREGARRIDDSLGTLDQEAAGVASVLREAADSVAFLGSLDAPLADAEAAFAELGPMPLTHADDLDYRGQELLASIGRLYTMASERTLHRTFEPAGSVEALANDNADPTALSNEDDDDDGLF